MNPEQPENQNQESLWYWMEKVAPTDQEPKKDHSDTTALSEIFEDIVEILQNLLGH